jgi:hypothetical protein
MLFRWRDYSPGHPCFGAEPGVAAGHAHARKARCPADARGARHHRGAVWQCRRTRRSTVRTGCFLGAEDAGGPSEVAGAPHLPEQTNPNAPEIPASGRGPGARSWAACCNRRGSRWRAERAAAQRNAHDGERLVYDRAGAVFPARLRRHIFAAAGGDPAAVQGQAPGGRYLTADRGRHLRLSRHHHRHEPLRRGRYRDRDRGMRAWATRCCGEPSRFCSTMYRSWGR